MNEVVLGTVDRIIGTSVFVKLKDYSLEGVIIFSEVAPGRIRNIRDYVMPGQKIAVKVLRVDKAKKHVDLSLRRVSAQEKKQAFELEKREKELSIVLELVVKDKTKREKTIKSIKEFGIVNFLNEVLKRETNALKLLVQFGLNEQEAQEFVRKIKEKTKAKKVSVKVKISLRCYEMDGVDRIKKVLDLKEGKINYVGAPYYVLSVEDSDYKAANKRIEALLQEIEKRAKQQSCEIEILRNK
ncbi:MAG: S1 RNA-binding domain-containing protein [Candidatus Pacearchaeota archaeon]